MGETNGLCLKALSVAFVNGLAVEMQFLIVMCPPTAIVINFVEIPRSGMLGRGTFFFFFLTWYLYFQHKQDRHRFIPLQQNLFPSLSHVKRATLFCA